MNEFNKIIICSIIGASIPIILGVIVVWWENRENKVIEVICKKCNGNGELEQDVNLLMTQASFAIWHNLHVNSNEKCKTCSEKFCETAQKKYDEIITKYKETGPKIEKAMCPECMGAGTYKQYKGFRTGKEKF